MKKIDLSTIGTEKQNQNTMNIDELETFEMLSLINQEDARVIEAVKSQLPAISEAVDLIATTIEKGGRLVYIGAGTSGRLGVLDASEVLPTFGVGEEAVIGLIAGGDRALRNPVEAAEDDKNAVINDLKAISMSSSDVLCAIAASGRTPYCLSGIEYAQTLGAKTIGLACVEKSEMGRIADIVIEANVGQEVITGSTRMKSGTATKLILNMLNTGAMIKLGKVYGNLMVDVKTSNHKLVERAKGILMKATNCSYERAEALLELAQNNVKTAIVMELKQLDVEPARQLLEDHHGHIAKTLSLTEV